MASAVRFLSSFLLIVPQRIVPQRLRDSAARALRGVLRVSCVSLAWAFLVRVPRESWRGSRLCRRSPRHATGDPRQKPAVIPRNGKRPVAFEPSSPHQVV
jgi:hypothetical protein